MEKQGGNIFEEVDAFFKYNTHETFRHRNNVLCRFDQDLDYYTLYRENSTGQPVTVVYVTRQYLQSHQDHKALEKTVMDYLNSKDGMQATFKTSGVEEAPLFIL